jgi:hypothetical protein
MSSTCPTCHRDTHASRQSLGDGTTYFNVNACTVFPAQPGDPVPEVLLKTRLGAWILATVDPNRPTETYRQITNDEAEMWQHQHRGGPRPCKEV